MVRVPARLRRCRQRPSPPSRRRSGVRRPFRRPGHRRRRRCARTYWATSSPLAPSAMLPLLRCLRSAPARHRLVLLPRWQSRLTRSLLRRSSARNRRKKATRPPPRQHRCRRPCPERRRRQRKRRKRRIHGLPCLRGAMARPQSLRSRHQRIPSLRSWPPARGPPAHPPRRQRRPHRPPCRQPWLWSGRLQPKPRTRRPWSPPRPPPPPPPRLRRRHWPRPNHRPVLRTRPPALPLPPPPSPRRCHRRRPSAARRQLRQCRMIRSQSWWSQILRQK
mmetsp:Transcript_22148/g.61969  ORF Transcript_22148/g.61969 Transcript_22148/m.61969 type:complete len:276 (+) Transcript_22148:608-1435(+)